MPALSRVVGRLLNMRARSLTLPVRGSVTRAAVSVPTVAVVGGGIAGASTALVLAERGIPVVLYETADRLGGRLAAHPRMLPDETVQHVDHGFHGFFRQYYTWRAILDRIDRKHDQVPLLQPLGSYPIVSRQWPAEEFAGLPPTPPVSILTLLARSPSLRVRDLRRADPGSALALLGFDPQHSYRRLDDRSAADLLGTLGLTDRARSMLFNVFAHSFFNDPATMSAAELVAMFHFYFLANPEGLGMDAPRRDYQHSIWAPMDDYLTRQGALVRTDHTVTALRADHTGCWRIDTTDGASATADEVVLALDAAAAGYLLAGSPDACNGDPQLAAVADQPLTGPPYAVARYWLDGDVDLARAPFTSIADPAVLDSVTAYHRLEHDAHAWYRRTGGAVLELHAYACPDRTSAADLGQRMLDELHVLWPETCRLTVVDEHCHVGHDAAGFSVGSHALRPGVATGIPHLQLAGDWVAAPVPCALMERAAVTGVLAANNILTAYGHPPEPIWSVPPRGLLADPWIAWLRRRDGKRHPRTTAPTR